MDKALTVRDRTAVRAVMLRLKQELIAMQKKREFVKTTPTKELHVVTLQNLVFVLRVPANVIPLRYGTTLTGRNRVTFAGRNPRQQLT